MKSFIQRLGVMSFLLFTACAWGVAFYAWSLIFDGAFGGELKAWRVGHLVFVVVAIVWISFAWIWLGRERRA